MDFWRLVAAADGDLGRRLASAQWRDMGLDSADAHVCKLNHGEQWCFWFEGKKPGLSCFIDARALDYLVILATSWMVDDAWMIQYWRSS